jgi:hypothetical protein
MNPDVLMPYLEMIRHVLEGELSCAEIGNSPTTALLADNNCTAALTPFKLPGISILPKNISKNICATR